MMHSVLAALLILCATLGCTGPKYDFPKAIDSDCNRAMAAAKSSIESVGAKTAKPHDCVVKTHPGQRKYENVWCWYDAGWGQYVGGLCWGNRIEAGCNPTTGGDVSFLVLHHEFGHHWRMPLGDNRHDPQFKNLFLWWHDPVQVKMLLVTARASQEQLRGFVTQAMQESQIGARVSLSGVDTNGVNFHVDFIKLD